MNEGYRILEVVKSVLNNRRFGIKAKKCVYEEVIVSTALFGTEAWSNRGDEVRNLAGVSRMHSVRNEKVRRRAGIERESASRADQRVLRWFGHVERMNEYHMARRADGGCKCRAGTG